MTALNSLIPSLTATEASDAGKLACLFDANASFLRLRNSQINLTASFAFRNFSEPTSRQPLGCHKCVGRAFAGVACTPMTEPGICCAAGTESLLRERNGDSRSEAGMTMKAEMHWILRGYSPLRMTAHEVTAFHVLQVSKANDADTLACPYLSRTLGDRQVAISLARVEDSGSGAGMTLFEFLLFKSYKCSRRVTRTRLRGHGRATHLGCVAATNAEGERSRGCLHTHDRAQHLLCRRHRISLARVMLFRVATIRPIWSKRLAS